MTQIFHHFPKMLWEVNRSDLAPRVDVGALAQHG
jgi:hypothetical protein